MQHHAALTLSVIVSLAHAMPSPPGVRVVSGRGIETETLGGTWPPHSQGVNVAFSLAGTGWESNLQSINLGSFDLDATSKALRFSGGISLVTSMSESAPTTAELLPQDLTDYKKGLFLKDLRSGAEETKYTVLFHYPGTSAAISTMTYVSSSKVAEAISTSITPGSRFSRFGNTILLKVAPKDVEQTRARLLSDAKQALVPVASTLGHIKVEEGNREQRIEVAAHVFQATQQLNALFGTLEQKNLVDDYVMGYELAWPSLSKRLASATPQEASGILNNIVDGMMTTQQPSKTTIVVTTHPLDGAVVKYAIQSDADKGVFTEAALPSTAVLSNVERGVYTFISYRRDGGGKTQESGRKERVDCTADKLVAVEIDEPR